MTAGIKKRIKESQQAALSAACSVFRALYKVVWPFGAFAVTYVIREVTAVLDKMTIVIFTKYEIRV
ncbi:hypothetical protein RF007C_10260 [Ruminococcus flavefaciens 007c]|uniref:Uncharacterized protein n=1 Tax=Ruminococcus flavefaciens 007c TaxID=1341157 RepID=W7UXE5_RUMFL|nr:hypothetical protein RF007C_10260 [Ruminococcus flavefaciens 007c]